MLLPARTDLLKAAAFASLVALICACALLLAACSKREIPSSAPAPVLRAWAPVVGKSMLPAFPERAWIEVETVPFDALQVGDSVVFWDYTRPGKIIHHRLVARQGSAFIAQGDNPATNPTADRPWVTRDNYLARCTGEWMPYLPAP